MVSLIVVIYFTKEANIFITFCCGKYSGGELVSRDMWSVVLGKGVLTQAKI